jgi:hypothetical protein
MAYIEAWSTVLIFTLALVALVSAFGVVESVRSEDAVGAWLWGAAFFLASLLFAFIVWLTA